ncbi:IQ motif containing F3, isoform CRA_b [Rattus norvegicus]|uniref:IQ motif containing F3, isoform CRA_b n=2 Tax=Rattus norvegicus TaxID=10116 RepID=A6I2U1_RAT|nr:IQ motif containing F3, isoform CRA_b [Rattus norvegicus]
MGSLFVKPKPEVHQQKKTTQPKPNCSSTSEEDEVVQKKQSLKEKFMRNKKKKAAIQVQAWWRGTLVRRSLLHAALKAWVIQCWWRLMLQKMLEKKRRKALIDFSNRERAVVTLQSLVRMWRIHWRYCQVLSAIYTIQGHWKHHNCQSCSLLRGHCVITTTHLQFHIEIIDH